jgi:hypothetical protein
LDESFHQRRRDGFASCCKSLRAATNVLAVEPLLLFISLRHSHGTAMIKPLSCVLVAALLTACGGGDSSGSAPPAAATPSPAAAAPAPGATSPAVVLETPPAAPNITIAASRMNIETSGGDYAVNFSGNTHLEVSGNLNRFWVTAAQPGGEATISGGSNTLIFRPGATPAIVTVTGSANTFFLPEGSALKLTGAAAAMSTVKYYKP